MVEEYLGGFTKSWGNDINNTQIVVKKTVLSMSRVHATLAFYRSTLMT
jgi:hypothetical protein